ncbi:hypothetical protein JQ557_15595 [Bradyrhizobium sp. U87765 SZCCT0131]|uniref:hypothetical protein n=1 Tax=unclassified Bradyrhizobium TaxID=2631580 RepID=UPI001BA45E1B|nr:MULTISPECIES: hypothetical protein [unclassified Bradyrhizobium]MBR1219427.1 hypothetical protein [Bradyrhizobium sp. U87765 SZCCT0131]MBR1262078.1 hypothetical protein [Bradyrhizobium sp. U87765 SZCCT0134]MBR1306069.1 hypothetical protein [Bradyrhizobium sp. U87765 SZCCT0110]MBR1317860.1 hypothetical protein [Bradyrhizobium sp. U87765 SZCCT0109]MBR1351562.1 hypothetical protein [Bradyrhizobium sp. U87765 SZCCT0048]
MTDTDLGAQLSPDEQSYFDTSGQTDIPADTGAAPAAADDSGQPQQDGAGEPQQERVVPLAALHEERGRRRDLDRQNRDLQQQVAELRGKFSIIDRLASQPQQREPTVEDDIFGVVRNTSSAVSDIRRRLDAADQEKQEVAWRDDLVRAYQIDAAQFESRTPDFKAAYNHLLQSRAQELVALGYDDPQAVHQALLADEFAVAQMALQSRRSPAEVIYNLARQRGYSKGAGSAQGRLDTIARGQAAGKSFAGAGGGGADSEMSAEALLRMPMDEFEAWCAKNPARAKRIMGG